MIQEVLQNISQADDVEKDEMFEKKSSRKIYENRLSRYR